MVCVEIIKSGSYLNWKGIEEKFSFQFLKPVEFRDKFCSDCVSKFKNKKREYFGYYPVTIEYFQKNDICHKCIDQLHLRKITI